MFFVRACHSLHISDPGLIFGRLWVTGGKIGLGLVMTIIQPAVNAGKDWNNQELGNSVNHSQPGGEGQLCERWTVWTESS